MTFGITKLFCKNKSGFTLIEIMVSLAITAFIGLGASMASAQVLNVTTRNNNYTAASRNAMNAVYWIGRDALMAQNISGVAGFPGTSALSLSWSEWDNSSHNATYSLQNGRLLRTYVVDGQSTGTLAAEYINSNSSLSYCTSVNGTLFLTITSSVGQGSKAVNVTETRKMTCRPKL